MWRRHLAGLYESINNNGILIFSNNNQVLFKKKTGSLFSNTFVAANDYLCNLSDVVLNGTIYFAYINTNNCITITRLSDLSVICLINPDNDISFINPKIAVFNNELILFYIEKGIKPKANQGEIYKIRVSFPIKQAKSNENPFLKLSDNEYNLIPEISFVNCGDILMISINAQSESNYYVLDKAFEIDELIQRNKLDLIIERATKQYNELMDVANQYKAEAIKWRSKFTS